MKVAIVYDRVNKIGGAERVLLQLNRLFPKAILYTSVYDQKSARWASVFPKIISSSLNKVPFASTNHDKLAIFMPYIFENYNFNNFDLVISVTSEFAKGVITSPKTKHICYCLTPTRYLYSGEKEYFKNPLIKLLATPFIKYLKTWDKVAINRPDKILAISKTAKNRILKYYNKEAELLYPAAGVFRGFRGKSKRPKTKNYYLIVSRLVPYKKIDLAINVFNKINKNLVIVGVGSEMRKLQNIANNNISFSGQLTDKELKGYYENCEALIMPQEEDLGLVSLEAQYFGKPVVGLNMGGAHETVIDGKTGILYSDNSISGLIAAINRLEKTKINPNNCKSNASKYTEAKFRSNFMKILEKVL